MTLKWFWTGLMASMMILTGCSAVAYRPESDHAWMQVCWQRDGQANYDELCASPSDFHWSADDIPLVIHVTESNDLLTRVVTRINEEVGCQVLVIHPGADSRFNHDIAVALEVPFEPGFTTGRGSTNIRRDAMGRFRVSIEVYALGMSSTMTYQILMHELGHALGLAHDEWTGSIMYPTVRGDDMSLDLIGITDSDEEMLNALYCPR